MGRRDRELTRGHEPQNGITPLHAAVQKDHLAVARLLLEAKADINAKDAVSGRSVGDAGLECEREKVSGKADSVGGSSDDLPGMDEKAF